MCIHETKGNLLDACCGEHSQPSITLPRRAFLGGVATAGLVSSLARSSQAFDEPAATVKRKKQPAESLIKELYASLSDTQKKEQVHAYNHQDENKLARNGMYNAPFGGKKIGDHYSKPQQELIDRILKAMTGSEEGYVKITRGGRFDNSKNLQGCGATFFGNATDENKYCFMFTSHPQTGF